LQSSWGGPQANDLTVGEATLKPEALGARCLEKARLHDSLNHCQQNMGKTSQLVADELKQLVGWGAHPRRLATMRAIAALVEVDPGRPVVLGFTAREHLERSIASFDQDVIVAGKRIDADRARSAFRILLAIEHEEEYSFRRRQRVIELLKFEQMSVDQWRRPFGPERELLNALAEHLCSGDAVLIG
jgi:hypothetical protein